MKNTKDIGNIGEAVAIAEFIKRGIPVLTPFGDNLPYDLVVETSEGFKKIQVKTTERVKDGVMLFTTCITEPYKKINRKYKAEEVDYFFLYCVENGYVGILPFSEYTSRDTPIRVEVPKNNQFTNVKMYYDYVFDKKFIK